MIEVVAVIEQTEYIEAITQEVEIQIVEVTGFTVGGEGDVGTVSFSEITGSPTSNTALATILNAKLDDSQASVFGLGVLGALDASAGRSLFGLGSAAIANSSDFEPAFPEGTIGQYFGWDKEWKDFPALLSLGTTSSTAGRGDFTNTAYTHSQITTGNPHGTAIGDIPGLSATLSAKADLVGGLIPSSQLPSFVDDVLEFANLAALPVTGESGKIYVTLDDNKTYRWSGSAYVEISASLALGTTSSTAGRGDFTNTAYTHSQITTGNPHGTAIGDISGLTTELAGKEPTIALGIAGQYWSGTKTFQTLDKAAVGLDLVNNTSDLNKPISTATQAALDLKANASAVGVSKRLTAAVTYTNTTTPVIVTELSGWSLDASSTYRLDMELSGSKVSSSNRALTVRFDAPGAGIYARVFGGTVLAGNVQNGYYVISTNSVVGSNSVSTEFSISLSVTITTTIATTLDFLAAQAASNSTSAVIFIGSNAILRKL